MGCHFSRDHKAFRRRRAASESSSDTDVETVWYTAQSPSSLPRTPQTADDRCTCGLLEHERFEITTPLCVLPRIRNTLLERIVLAESLCGRWETVLERSDSLNDIYAHLGVNIAKRAVMNRLRLQIQVYLDYTTLVLICLLYTPLGVRTMRTDLKGGEAIDDDPDCGRWRGHCSVTDDTIEEWGALFSPHRFCGRPVRQLSQKRHNDSKGVSIETRIVLPDKEYGQVMRTQLLMFPDPSNMNSFLACVRVLKKTGPVDRELQSCL
ncbi:MAG: uncharacterized protein KVP18_000025 [Porospora cf. gigantea A]|uniref:uncharacterized protein n=1 Tax=Porospora cf. gigantea A TaxID=2853593 RepID=UPI00355AA0B3|nr:MAG: hypothetical protein KVP18_000025 [Porospora cf. gigantea A]